MSSIYILSPNEVLQSRIKEVCQADFPESFVQVLNSADLQEFVVPGKNRILIVEDEKIKLMLIKRMLQKKGLDVLTAMDGREALEVMNSNRDISLILMDVMVPVHDGYELTRMIRSGELNGLKQVPIVAVTALADAASRQHCFEAGMNAYLSKPVDNRELMKMIRRYLAER